jgi:hypothetical protein
MNGRTVRMGFDCTFRYRTMPRPKMHFPVPAVFQLLYANKRFLYAQGAFSSTCYGRLGRIARQL